MSMGKDQARRQSDEEDSTKFFRLKASVLENSDVDTGNVKLVRDSVPAKSKGYYNTRVRFYEGDQLLYTHISNYTGDAKFSIATD